MKGYYRLKNLSLYFLIILLGLTTLYAAPGVKKSNYYLGVLTEGYPHSLVISEFQYANAEVVNLSDNLVLFGINEDTKLTTFFKNLPFLKEVYVDAESLKGKISLNSTPLAREFLFLLQRDKAQPGNPPHVKDLDSLETGSNPFNSEGSAAAPASTPGKGSLSRKPGLKSSQNNMAVIDKLIREKAKKNSAQQGVEK